MASSDGAAPAPRERACSACGQPGHYARTCGRAPKTRRQQRCMECDAIGHNAATCPVAARDAERLRAEPATVRPARQRGMVAHIPADVAAALAAEASAIKARTGRDLTPSQLAAELLRAAIGPREES